MDWLSSVTFDSKAEPLSKVAELKAKTLLGQPLSQVEIVEIEHICGQSNEIDYLNWSLPNYTLPKELIDLLKYSNGGFFYNGDREIGLFGLDDIRDYYLRYMFPEFQKGAVPFGFNDGGTFYAYDLRALSDSPPIIATSSGCLDWASSVVLGDSLAAVFSKNTDIDEEFV